MPPIKTRHISRKCSNSRHSRPRIITKTTQTSSSYMFHFLFQQHGTAYIAWGPCMQHDKTRKHVHEEADDLWMTWMRMTVWPLEIRLSVAHLMACWLALSLSMATATRPLRPLFRPRLLAFTFGSHIVQTHAHRSLFRFNLVDDHFFLCLFV